MALTLKAKCPGALQPRAATWRRHLLTMVLLCLPAVHAS